MVILLINTMKLSLIFMLVIAVQSQKILEEFKSHPNWNLVDHGTKCGKSGPRPRIIGGREASLGQFPWLALLVTADLQNNIDPFHYLCGGSVISDRYILTAAHCLQEDKTPVQVDFVRLGEHDKSTDIDCDVNNICAPPPQDIKVEESIVHPEYDGSTYKHDIALLRLSSPIQFNKFVKPICLPIYDVLQKNNFQGVKMETAGWGRNDVAIREKFANVLKTLRIPVLSQSQCLSVISYSDLIGEMIPQQMCAGGVIGQDSCLGDSGGPLMKAYDYGGRPRHFVIGIVSFGLTDCGSGTPAIYTKVPDYVKWILDNIRK